MTRTTVPPVTFGEYLERAMTRSGFKNNAALARATGISESTIGRWQRGEKEPSIPNLRALCAVLDVRLGELIVACGLATREELGLTGPATEPPVLPAELQVVVTALRRPAVSAQAKRTLLAAVGRTYEMWEEMRAQPVKREPRMTGQS